MSFHNDDRFEKHMKSSFRMFGFVGFLAALVNVAIIVGIVVLIIHFT